MRVIGRNLAICAGLFVVAFIAHVLLEPRWNRAFSGPFSVSFHWLNWLWVRDWTYIALLLFASGVAVAALVRSKRPLVWAAAFGFCLGYAQLLLADPRFTSVPRNIDLVWTYGGYLVVAPIAASIGAMLAIYAPPWKHGHGA
jgi:hypothetical protein